METETTNTQLDLNDIALMTNIIYTASRRGAFEPAEFKIVGTLFEKLKSFLPEPEAEETGEAVTANTSTEVEAVPENQITVDFSEAKA